MTKKSKNEQQDINKERIIDINLVLQYMSAYDINKEYFTELGEGHLRGLGSVKDEIKFISKDKYNKLLLKYSMLKEKPSKIKELEEENSKLKEQLEVSKLETVRWQDSFSGRTEECKGEIIKRNTYVNKCANLEQDNGIVKSKYNELLREHNKLKSKRWFR